MTILLSNLIATKFRLSNTKSSLRSLKESKHLFKKVRKSLMRKSKLKKPSLMALNSKVRLKMG
jgi:hypothetical protein